MNLYFRTNIVIRLRMGPGRWREGIKRSNIIIAALFSKRPPDCILNDLVSRSAVENSQSPPNPLSGGSSGAKRRVPRRWKAARIRREQPSVRLTGRVNCLIQRKVVQRSNCRGCSVGGSTENWRLGESRPRRRLEHAGFKLRAQGEIGGSRLEGTAAAAKQRTPPLR